MLSLLCKTDGNGASLFGVLTLLCALCRAPPFFRDSSLQHMPILVISDIMCRVGPIVYKLCPTAAPEQGVLPRIGEPNQDGMRQVDIPALALLPESNHIGGDEGSQPVVQQEPCDQDNVYNLLRDATTSPPQQLLDFGQLLDVSASSRDVESAGGEVNSGSFTAINFAFLARG